MKINLFDDNFSFTLEKLGYITASDTRKPTRFAWVPKQMEFPGITIFTDFYSDSDLIDKVKTDIKILWLVEPIAIHPFAYENAIKNEHKFDFILTYNTDLLKRDKNKYKLAIIGSSRIDDNDAKIYSKTKKISMIASNKSMTEGHRLRHEIYNQYGGEYQIDMYGSGYKPFTNRLDPFKDYQYSICVMNSAEPFFFTEVIVDAFRTGTFPIIWGCRELHRFFNEKGFFEFYDLSTLKHLLNGVKNHGNEIYHEALPAIQQNLLISNNYVSTEDSLLRFI